MTVEALKEEIAHLSEPEPKHLVDWLEVIEDQAWDSEMTRDFSVDGRAAYLMAEVQADVAASRTRPLSETIAELKANHKQALSGSNSNP